MCPTAGVRAAVVVTAGVGCVPDGGCAGRRSAMVGCGPGWSCRPRSGRGGVTAGFGAWGRERPPSRVCGCGCRSGSADFEAVRPQGPQGLNRRHGARFEGRGRGPLAPADRPAAVLLLLGREVVQRTGHLGVREPRAREGARRLRVVVREVVLARGVAGGTGNASRFEASSAARRCSRTSRPRRSAVASARGRSGTESRKVTAAWISYGWDTWRDSTACQQKSVARNSQACQTSLRCSRPTTGPVVSRSLGGPSTTGRKGAVG